MSNHAFFGSDLEELGHVEETDALDVDGAAHVVHAVVPVRVHLLHSCALVKLVRINDRVNFLLIAPVDKVCKHLLHLGQLKLAGPTES